MQIKLECIGNLFAVRYMGKYGHFKHLPDGFENEVVSLLLKQMTTIEDPFTLEIFLLEHGLADAFAKISGEISEISLAFIIGHECGHHYLDHTKNSFAESDPFEFMQSSEFEAIQQLNNRQWWEVHADRFATFFAYKFLEDIRNRNCSIYLPPAQLAGFVVAILTTSMGKVNPTIHGKHHPSTRTRYFLVLTYIQNVYGKSSALELIDMVNWFCEESGFSDLEQWETDWWKVDL